MLGYGGTDKPQDPSEYSTQRLCADLAALLDLLGVQRAVVIGHDWGAYTAARFALWHPERLLSLILLSVPYTPPSRVYKPIEDVVKLFPNFAYQAYFADPASTAPIEKDVRIYQSLSYACEFNRTQLHAFLSIVFKTTGVKKNFTSLTRSFRNLDVPREPSILNDKEFQVYLDVLGKGGMTGPLNYYRTSKHRHEEEERAGLPAKLSPNLPVLFMWGTADSTVAPAAVQNARKFIAQLQDVAFEGRGHWLMVEAKDEITNKVISWLRDLTRQPVRAGKL
ncbi:hypothetical protein C0993_007999 [Termitomyces sp. T159_Od127]|nr:hypothetical protein C0993_007999 [Termitomyces sp. T159_Od127]